eukprot:7996414-Alexandrium_andersonii.AAC.1
MLSFVPLFCSLPDLILWVRRRHSSWVGAPRRPFSPRSKRARGPHPTGPTTLSAAPHRRESETPLPQ